MSDPTAGMNLGIIRGPHQNSASGMDQVWIVDDDRSIRWVLEKALGREQISHRSFASAAEVLGAIDDGLPVPKVVISDVRMPGDSGLNLLAHLDQHYPDLPVIIMTAFSDLESAVSAFQGGAFEYLPKPFDVDQAIRLVLRALEQSRQQTPQLPATAIDLDILGQAPAMQELFRAIGRLTQSHATVLINGESGTGKELVARALHRHSPRADGPFIAINTAAIPRDLLESELFGHERGAFTGAQQQRVGRFEQADGGTLFLDEIGDMPAELQTRLLRVLSEGHFYRVGGHKALRSNVRVIAATHQDLEALVKQNRFREDLFHRLNVIRLRLPPLRERSEDIPVLVHHFLRLSAVQLGVDPKRVTGATLAHLQTLPFPGNVRQLENLCHWLTVMAPGSQIDPADLPPEIRPPDSDTRAGGMGSDSCGTLGRDAALDWRALLSQEADRLLGDIPGHVFDELNREFERTLIQRALAASEGRRIEAANLLGIGRNTITRKIQELDIDTVPGTPVR